MSDSKPFFLISVKAQIKREKLGFLRPVNSQLDLERKEIKQEVIAVAEPMNFHLILSLCLDCILLCSLRFFSKLQLVGRYLFLKE